MLSGAEKARRDLKSKVNSKVEGEREGKKGRQDDTRGQRALGSKNQWKEHSMIWLVKFPAPTNIYFFLSALCLGGMGEKWMER